MRKLLLLIMTMVAIHATSPTYENVTRLYVATFDRTPDVAGLKYWVNDSGLSLEQIARSFFDQPETQEKYYPTGTLYLYDFIEEVYINLFDRLPDSAGKEYWADDIMAGGIDRAAVFILAAINGAQGNDAVIIANKTKVAFDQIKDQLDSSDSGNGTDPSNGSSTIDDAVNQHNAIRAELYSGSALTWSIALAQSAQDYADVLAANGMFDHSGWGYGENLYAATFSATYTNAINSWYDEKSDYDYASNSCTPGAQCGHYTQIIWQDTTEFGCAKAIYKTGQYTGWTVVVCHYNPIGNYIGQRPY